MKYLAIPAILMTSLATGCASITTGQTQAISVETRDLQGKQVSGASCKLMNDKGIFFVTTPGTIGIQRSYGDVLVNCTKEQTEPGSASFKSSTKGMAFGNILVGGIIGAAVDVGTGAAYDYPSLLTIIMGQFASPASAIGSDGSAPGAAAQASAK